MGWGVQLIDRLFPTSRCTNNPANWPGNVLIKFMAFPSSTNANPATNLTWLANAGKNVTRVTDRTLKTKRLLQS